MQPLIMNAWRFFCMKGASKGWFGSRRNPETHWRTRSCCAKVSSFNCTVLTVALGTTWTRKQANLQTSCCAPAPSPGECRRWTWPRRLHGCDTEAHCLQGEKRKRDQRNEWNVTVEQQSLSGTHKNQTQQWIIAHCCAIIAQNFASHGNSGFF